MRLTIVLIGASVMVTPFAYMFSTSFKAQAYVLTVPPQLIPRPATLDNYRRALTTQDFGRYALNSLGVATASTALSVLLSAMMAYGFARYRFLAHRLLYRLLLVGLIVPAMMLIIPQFVLAKHLHLLDTYQGLIVFYVGSTLALNTYLLRGFFESQPIELDEAMRIDGASAWTRFVRLALPLARPALATTTIFTFLFAWDEFAWSLTIITDRTKTTLPVAIQFFHGQNATQWGLVFAASVIAVVPVIVVFVIFQRHFVQGLTSGAVKG